MNASVFYFTYFLFFSSVKGYIQLNSNILDGYLFPINATYLHEIFNYTFRNNYCIWLVSDESIIAKRIRKALHNFNYFAGVSNKKGPCPNVVYMSSTVKVFMNLINPRYAYSVRLLIIIINGNGKNLTQELTTQVINLFTYDQYVVMIDLEAPYHFFQHSAPPKTFIQHKLSDIRNIQAEINSGNFGGRKLRVGTFNCSVNSQIGPLDAEGRPSWIEGAEMKLFDAIAQQLNFTYEIVSPIGSYSRYRNSSIGLFDMAYDSIVDVAFCGIWMGTPIIVHVIPVTSHVHEICITYLVQRPQPLNQMSLVLFHSFEWKVWVLIFILIVAATIFLHVIALMTAKMDGHSHYQLTRFMNPINNVLQLCSTLCGDAPDSLAIFGPLRHVLVWWAIFSILISTLFSSSLISNLTATPYHKPPDSIKDMIEDNYYWSLGRNPFYFLRGVGFHYGEEWERKWATRFSSRKDRFHHNKEDSQCRMIKENKKKTGNTSSRLWLRRAVRRRS